MDPLIAAQAITGVRAALRGLLDDLRDKEGNVAELRAALASQIDRVELDPESERCVIHYRLTTGVNLASPRGPDAIPLVNSTTTSLQ